MTHGSGFRGLARLAPALPLVLAAAGCGESSSEDVDPPITAPEPVLIEESPDIHLWYGPEQTFGSPDDGAPQRWINVVGRITEARANSGNYRVNGGPDAVFPFGPTRTRLTGRGDFNLELDRDSLRTLPERNVIDIRVYTDEHIIHSRRMSLLVHPPAAVVPPRAVDFTTLEDVSAANQVAQIVDGRWHLTEVGIRTTEVGYDRLLALGSQAWSGNYEVLASLIVHSWRAWGGVGVAVGWQGHAGAARPREEWPVETLGWVRNAMPEAQLQLVSFQHGVAARRELDLDLERAYLLRLRTERAAGTSRIFLRVWPEDEAEPNPWLLTALVPPQDGSVLLVAHHADVTWRHVRVDPLP